MTRLGSWWLLFCGLIGSILLNFYLFEIGQKYYLELNSTRLDPLGLLYSSSTSTLIPTVKPSQPLIVILGDSRAAQWPVLSKMEQFSFINLGIGAQTSVQVAARFKQQVTSLHPQIVLVQVGINDLKTIPLFPEQKEQIIEECKKHIQDIVKDSQQIGATVILTTIFPAGYIPLIRRPFWSPDIAVAIDEINIFLHSLQAKDVILFDTASLLVNGSGAPDLAYYQDTLHLNAYGYDRLNQKLLEILSPAFTK